MPIFGKDGLATIVPAMKRFATGLIFLVINLAGMIYGFDIDTTGSSEFAS